MVLVLVLLGKIFSVSRVTVVSTQGSDLRSRTGGKDGSTVGTLELRRDPSGFLSSIRINVALVNLLANVFSKGGVTTLFNRILASTNLRDKLTSNVTRAVVVVVMACLSVIVKRLIPGEVKLKTTRGITGAVTKPVTFVSELTAPVM